MIAPSSPSEPDVETDTALTLQRGETFVEVARLHHVPVDRRHLLVGEMRIELGCERAILAQDTDHVG